MLDKIDHDSLYRTAESQAGYFTTRQAIDAGMDRSTLSRHARPAGRYARVRQGLYRLRHFPSSAHEHAVATWLSVSDPGTVISHESALELYDLSDVIPNAVHVSIPRTKRGQRRRPGVRFHTLEHPPAGREVRDLHGIRVTSPERTIVDALAAGTQPEQIELAITQALKRGLTTPRRLRAAAAHRSERVRDLIERTLRDLDGDGAPRWKQRALYDSIKDTLPASGSGVLLARVATHDRINGVLLSAMLDGTVPVDVDGIRALVEVRTA
jgi:predicted transcriptional regulator of viral defense system